MGDEAIDVAEALCKAHGITRLATYDTEPLAIEVRVLSSFGRRFLEPMTKVHQLALKHSSYFDHGRQAVMIQREYARLNPRNFAGYNEDCWGLTACDGANCVAHHSDVAATKHFCAHRADGR